MATLGLLVLLPATTWASSQDIFGLGARGTSMGGTVVSNAVGYAATYHNPAGLAFTGRREVSLGYQRGNFSMFIDGEDYDVDPASNFVLGLTIPLPFGGVLDERLTLGVGLLFPTASVLRAIVPAPETPYFVLVEQRSQVVGLHFGMGIQILDSLSVGATVVALAELFGSLDVAPNDTGNLGSVVRDELIADFSAIGGVRFEPIEMLSLGIAVHGESESRFNIPLTVDLGEAFPLAVPTLNVAGVAQFDPFQLSGDATLRPIPGLQLAVGVAWKRWSSFENPIENTTEPLPPQDDANFSNILVPRFGAEYRLDLADGWAAFRLGTFYEDTPVPDQVANSNFLDSTRIGLAGGFGFEWAGVSMELGIGWQHMLERTNAKDVALVRNPENQGLPELTHNGDIVSYTFEMGLGF